MKNLDFCTFFKGRLTADARMIDKEEKTTFFFTIAIENGYSNKNGEWIDKTRFISCAQTINNISDKRKRYLSDILLRKGNKIKGRGIFGDPKVSLSKDKQEPIKGKGGNYLAEILLFIEDMKLVAKPFGIKNENNKSLSTKDNNDDLPF